MPNVSTPHEHVPVFTAPASGTVDIDNAAEQLPAVPCRMVCLQADHDNSGSIYVGQEGLTTTGYRLAAGESSPWIPIDNLNRLYAYGTAANQNLHYLALS
jgi:hypothetical protein